MPALQAPCDGHRKTVTFVTFWKKCIDNHRHTWSLRKSCLQRRRRHGHWLAAAKQRGLRPFGSLRGTSGLDRTTESKRGLRKAHHETDRLDNWTTSTTVKTMIQCPCGPWIRYQNCFAYLWTFSFSLSCSTAWSSGGGYFGFCQDGFAVPQAWAGWHWRQSMRCKICKLQDVAEFQRHPTSHLKIHLEPWVTMS